MIRTWFVGRWNLEVTIENVRACLGFEIQWHWSDQAIERTPLVCWGSLVWLSCSLYTGIPTPYRFAPPLDNPKSQVSFSDALAAIRLDLWHTLDIDTSSADPDMLLLYLPCLI